MESKKKFGLRRILSVVLCLSMLLSPVVTLAESVINEGIESLAEPELILIQKAETKTVYKLVENYTAADISTSKTYMIVSTDVPGEASALGGAQRGDGRYLQTLNGLKVFEIPVQTTSLDPGKYVTNTFSSAEFGEWKFESAGNNAYYLVQLQKTTTVIHTKAILPNILTVVQPDIIPDTSHLLWIRARDVLQSGLLPMTMLTLRV